MSILTFLRCPTNSDLGELMLVDPLQRRALGHYELRDTFKTDNPPLYLYFNYEHDPLKTNIIAAEKRLVDERAVRFHELMSFYGALKSFGGFSTNYRLHSIHLPRGEPWISRSFT